MERNLENGRELGCEKTLLLNADYTIVKVIPWQTALKLWFSDKVSIVDNYDRFVKHPSAKIHVPAVVALKKYYNLFPHYKVRFSSDSLYARDNYTCSYCGGKFARGELTKDHVIPRTHFKNNKVTSPIRETSWHNIVTACRPCNNKKGGRTPEEAGMKLLKKPYEPKTLSMTFNSEKTPKEWQPYIPSMG